MAQFPSVGRPDWRVIVVGWNSTVVERLNSRTGEMGVNNRLEIHRTAIFTTSVVKPSAEWSCGSL